MSTFVEVDVKVIGAVELPVEVAVLNAVLAELLGLNLGGSRKKQDQEKKDVVYTFAMDEGFKTDSALGSNVE